MTTERDISGEINRSNDPPRFQGVSEGFDRALAPLMEELDPAFGPLMDRLAAYGSQPVSEVTQRQHIAAMQRAVLEEQVGAHRTSDVATVIQVRFRRVRVVAASVGVALLGASGLAAAGALPPAAQDFASDALGIVGLDVPRGNPVCEDEAPSLGDCVDDPAMETSE